MDVQQLKDDADCPVAPIVLLRLSFSNCPSSHERFDSQLKENVARKWVAQPREGWRLIREGVVRYQNQQVFVPDFLFVHQDGRRAVMEGVGVWTRPPSI